MYEVVQLLHFCRDLPGEVVMVQGQDCSLVRFPMADGIESDKMLMPRSRYRRRRSLPRSDGMEPVRLVFVRLRTERKERLPMWGLISPSRGTSDRTRAVTRCLRRLHETPTQLQKDTFAVQLCRRMPRGSESWALKASSGARSVSLLGDGVENTMVVTVSKKVRCITRRGLRGR